MKKIIILIAITILSVVSANANEVNIINRIDSELMKSSLTSERKVKEYDFFVNKKQLGIYLGVSDTVQLENVYRTYESFCDGMAMAGAEGNEETRLSLIFNSIDYALRGMECYLNKTQYRKFLSGLNYTLYNKGFVEETFLYCDRYK